MKELMEKFNKLSVRCKIQLMAAILVTLSLMIVVPTAAWLNYQREIVKLQKVKSPNVLYLSAAHREDSVNFEVKGIDADEILKDGNGNPILDQGNNKQRITHKDYVFCVTGDAVDKFTIQLAYTTNNPFEYEVYAAKEVIESQVQRIAGQEFGYVEYTLTGNGVTGMPTVSGDDYHTGAAANTKLYYQIDTSITDNGRAVAGKYSGIFRNLAPGSSGSNQDALSTGAYHELTYDEYTHVQKDAEPVYWQALNVSAFPTGTNSNKDAFSRHFILRVKWNPGDLDNTSKETDILYITVKATK